MQQAKAWGRANQTQRAIRHAESERENFLREIQQLQRAGADGPGQAAKNRAFQEREALAKNDKTYDPPSSLSKEFQQHP
jgi:hypothetical protein